MRTLRADEVECRVQTVKENGCSILLYKDARCDMRILDETYGPLNWQRRHTRENANCIVSVWDADKSQWVEKEDTGTESNTEKEKGQASDSFKRACFNWGIGRELYSAPFIWITLGEKETYKQNNGKLGVSTKFEVASIGYNEHKEITELVIKDGTGKIRYTLGAKHSKEKQTPPPSNNKAETVNRATVKAKFFLIGGDEATEALFDEWEKGQLEKGYSYNQMDLFLTKKIPKEG